MKKWLVTIGLVLLTLLIVRVGRSQAASGRTVVSVLGRGKVDGQDTMVEVLVGVEPGENGQDKGRDVLKRLYPQMELIESADYTTTGMVFDQFFDNDPGNDYVDVQYNPSGAPGQASDDRQVWLDSMATWTNVASASFVYADNGDTGRCPSLVQECKGPQKFDGYNDVGWGNIADPSVLGVTWYGTQNDEFDMWIDNKNFSWYIGDPAFIPSGWYDLQTVWTHELGHGLGLGHSTVNGSIMEPYYEGVRRNLSQDDIDGITSLYPVSGPLPSPTPTPSPSSSPTPTPTPSPTPIPGNQLNLLGVDYQFFGSNTGDKNLRITVWVVDENGIAVGGADVDVVLNNADTGQSWVGTGVSASDGSVSFVLRNAPVGCYDTTVTGLTLVGYSWDGLTPANGACKAAVSGRSH